jgi:glycosyltransferase involved in cell wall biosynthesis
MWQAFCGWTKKMKDPTVSVVITTQNRSLLLKRATASVLAQTYADYDLHIVDDGSTDETPDIVRQVMGEHRNVFYWRHEESRGLCAARNTGIAKSQGEFVAFLDDDEWKPDSLEKRMRVFQEMTQSERERLGVIYSV